MTADSLITMQLGNENFQSEHCTVACFGWPATFADPRGALEEVHIWELKKRGLVGATNQLLKESAYKTAGYDPSLGVWDTATFTVPEGAVLKIYARKYSGHGRPISTAQQLIQARPDAPFNEIRIALTGNYQARYREAIIKGKFDLLELAALDDELREVLDIDPRFQHQFTWEAQQGFMSFRQLEGAGTPRPRKKAIKVIDPESQKKEVVQVKVKPRAIKLNDD